MFEERKYVEDFDVICEIRQNSLPLQDDGKIWRWFWWILTVCQGGCLGEGFTVTKEWQWNFEYPFLQPYIRQEVKRWVDLINFCKNELAISPHRTFQILHFECHKAIELLLSIIFEFSPPLSSEIARWTTFFGKITSTFRKSHDMLMRTNRVSQNNEKVVKMHFLLYQLSGCVRYTV